MGVLYFDQLHKYAIKIANSIYQLTWNLGSIQDYNHLHPFSSTFNFNFDQSFSSFLSLLIGQFVCSTFFQFFRML